MSTRAKRLLSAAVGFALLGSSEAVLASPYMTFSILGSTDPTAPLSSWQSNLTVGVGDTVYVVVVGKMNDALPLSNSALSGSLFPTMVALTPADNGLKQLKFSLIQDAPDAANSKNLLQADFQTLSGLPGNAGATAFSNGKTDSVWASTSAVAGVPTARTGTGASGSDMLGIFASRLGGSPLYAGVDPAGNKGLDSYIVMEKFVVGGTAQGTSQIKGFFDWVSQTSGSQAFQYKKTSTTNQAKSVITDWANPTPAYAADPIAQWNFLTLTPAGSGNDSVLTPAGTLPLTVSLSSPGADAGKVIFGDPITSQSVTVNKTSATGATATLVLQNTGTATSSGAGPVAGASTVITVGSTATALVPAGAAQTLGTVVVKNTANTLGTDADDTITLSAVVISRAGNSVIQQTGTPAVTIPFAGGLLAGGKYVVSGTGAIPGVSQVTPASTGGSYNTTALVTADGNVGVAPGFSSVPVTDTAGSIPFALNTTGLASNAGLVTLSGNVHLQNGATDSASSQHGSAQSPITIPISQQVNVGSATAGSSGFGNALGATVGVGESYAGLSSKVSGGLNTEAKILNSVAATAAGSVTMAWRAPATGELHDANYNPALFKVGVGGLNSPTPYIVSDVVDLNGIAAGTVYVLQISFDPAQVPDLAGAIAQRHVQLAWLNGALWQPAEATEHFIADATNINKGIAYNGSLTVGDWSVDPTPLSNGQMVVWEVLDHNSAFAVVPEPATLGLLGIAAFGLTMRRRRHSA